MGTASGEKIWILVKCDDKLLFLYLQFKFLQSLFQYYSKTMYF